MTVEALSFRRAVGLGMGALLAEPALAEQRSVRVGATYVSDSFANLTGGLARGTRQMGKLDLIVEADGDAIGLDGVEAFVDLQFVHGKSLSGDLIGDAQVVSNIEAPDGVRPFEAWLSVPVAKKGFVKAGLVDLNSEFDVQSVGALFLNSSHGIGPDFSQSGRNGPSIFPTTASALVLGWNEQNWSARLGLFDAVAGNPDRARRTVIRFPGETGLLVAAELDVKVTKHVELQFGGWAYSPRFETIDPDDGDARMGRWRNRGAYGQIEGKIGAIGSRPIHGWARAGVAETEINPIGLYLGGGITAGEEDNRLGLAVAHARLGRPAAALFAPAAPDRAETIFELTYAFAIGARLTVQPDVQYVINPGWDRSLKNALVAGLRVVFQLF